MLEALFYTWLLACAITFVLSIQHFIQVKKLFPQMTWVPNELEGYNCIVVEFLDRLAEPKGWLIKLWEVLDPQGVLVIVTPKQKERQAAIQTNLKKW